MEIQYSPEARKRAEGKMLMEKASSLLEETLGPQSSQIVNAEWDCLQDRNGRALYRLTIQDFTDPEGVFTDFAADELQNPLHMKFRLYRLWGDLLQIRNNRQHAAVQTISDEIIAGQEGF
ncbi:MAG: hypothetical protein ACR2FY_13085 [Pirellulaceae bacterium]